MRRPKRIRVGPYTFTVDWSERGWSDTREAMVAGYDADLGRAYGFTDRRNLGMWINPNAPIELQREALLHEVMHACQAVAALPNAGYVGDAVHRPGDVTGEDFITRLAPILLDALARNRDLAAFITSTEA